MPVRQYQILRIIQDQGSKATLSKVSAEAERKPNVISRITMRMEKDGLITRTKIKPKSNLLKLELTQKGVNMVNASKKSKSIDKVFSSLSLEEHQKLESILNKLISHSREDASK
jgi:DNA-binding MarR family transcriptional regulator